MKKVRRIMSAQKDEGGQQRGQGGQPGHSEQAPQQAPKSRQQRPKSEEDPQFDDDKLWEQGGAASR